MICLSQRCREQRKRDKRRRRWILGALGAFLFLVLFSAGFAQNRSFEEPSISFDSFMRMGWLLSKGQDLKVVGRVPPQERAFYTYPQKMLFNKKEEKDTRETSRKYLVVRIGGEFHDARGRALGRWIEPLGLLEVEEEKEEEVTAWVKKQWSLIREGDWIVDAYPQRLEAWRAMRKKCTGRPGQALVAGILPEHPETLHPARFVVDAGTTQGLCPGQSVVLRSADGRAQWKGRIAVSEENSALGELTSGAQMLKGNEKVFWGEH